MSRKIISLFLCVFMIASSFSIVFAEDAEVSSCGIYKDGKSLTEFPTGEIYAKAEVKSENTVLAVLVLYNDGEISDMAIGSGKSGEIVTGTVNVTEITDTTLLKLCIITDIANGMAEIKEYKGNPEGDVEKVEMAQFNSGKYYRIMSNMLGKYLCDSGKYVSYETAENKAIFLWKIINDGDRIIIQNKGTGKYLCSSDDTIRLNTKEINDTDYFNWEICDIGGGIYSIKNLTNNLYVNVENAGLPQCNGKNPPMQYDNWAAQWSITDGSMSIPDPNAEFKSFKAEDYSNEVISVVSPEYYSEIEGDVRIKFYAPFTQYITATCFAPEGEYGKLATVAIAPVNDSGFGAFTFHADEFPHGPITIRLTSSGKVKDFCGLMLYNNGGVPFNEGADAFGQPKAAEGLELTFIDDFDDPDLSIGDGDPRARYYSHTPGAVDYSGLPFTNFNSGEKNPFSQKDTYLRIRADEKLNSAGLISSMTNSKTGTLFRPPYYMECRFICQNAIGTWPAFWMCTQDIDTFTNRSLEIDSIEAYGVRDLQNPLAYTFSSGYILHGVEPRNNNGKFHDMREIGSGGSWDTDFHTYAYYVDENEIVFYLDNIELSRYDAPPETKNDPAFFMINLAVGGTSGWPIDLSRYNYKADMYVDWVKVYSKPENVIKK